jgi:hypothetical protein
MISAAFLMAAIGAAVGGLRFRPLVDDFLLNVVLTATAWGLGGAIGYAGCDWIGIIPK